MATSSPPADEDLIEMVVDDEVLSFSKHLLMQSSPFFQHTFTDGQPKRKRAGFIVVVNSNDTAMIISLYFHPSRDLDLGCDVAAIARLLTETKAVISGVSGQTFKHLLGYMKSGKLELSCNNIADIFHAACKLQMPDIIRQCIEMEARTSAVGRQIILYKAAKRVNNVEEMNAALYRMASNFTLVTQSDEFLELDSKDVCELLSSDVLSCDRELDVFNAACRWLNYKVDTRLALTSRLMYCVRFPLMSLMELSHCVEADTPPGLQDDHNFRVMVLSAVCFWVAKTAGKEAEVGHLSCTPRHYIKKDPGALAGGLERAMTCGKSEQPSLLSVTLGAAKARLDPAVYSNIGGTEELQIASVLESSHIEPKPSIEQQEVGPSLSSSTAECGSSMESVAATACESTISNILSSDTQTTCLSTHESDESSVTQDTRCTYSPSDFCSPSDDDKDQLSSQSVDSVILTGYSGGDIDHREYIANLKTKLLLSSQRGAEHEPLLTRSPLLSEQPEVEFLVACANIENSVLPSASLPMGVERHNFSDAPCKDGEQGTLFLIGGVDADESPSACPILSYSIKGNIWSPRKTLPVHRYGHKAVFLDGCIYIIGGFENFSPVNLEKASSRCCFWFEVSSSKWGIMAPLINTRAHHGLAVLDNAIYAVGGVDSNNKLLACLERYDKAKDEWTKLSGELYSPRMAMGFCSHKRQLWVAGGIVQIGRRTCSTAYVEVYNPETERWSFAVNFLPSPRSCLTLVECGGTMYAVGGLLSHRCGRKRNFTTVEDTLAFVDERKTWVHRTPMPNARHTTVAAAHDGVIFIIGGRQAERPDYHFDNILAYDTKLDKWMTLGNLPRNVTDYYCVLAPPGEPSDHLRELLTSRGDHRLPTKMAERFPVTAPDVKSYSQGDIAVQQQNK